MTLLDDAKAVLRPFADHPQVTQNLALSEEWLTPVSVGDLRRAAAVLARLDALGERLETTAKDRDQLAYQLSHRQFDGLAPTGIAVIRDFDRLLLRCGEAK